MTTPKSKSTRASTAPVFFLVFLLLQCKQTLLLRLALRTAKLFPLGLLLLTLQLQRLLRFRADARLPHLPLCQLLQLLPRQVGRFFLSFHSGA